MNEPVSQEIFDARAVRRHRDRAAAQRGRVAAVLEDLGDRLLDRLDDTRAGFATVLEIGGRGSVAAKLQARGALVVSADFSAALARSSGGLGVAVDGEALPFGDRQFDLVVAPMSLHWVNDLPGALIQLRRTLRPGGLFLASMPVLGTLAELRACLLDAELMLTGGVSPRVSPYPDLRDCAGLLQRAGFALPVAELEEIALLYAQPQDLLLELRAAGETNAVTARSRRIPPKALFPLALSDLPMQDNRVVASLKMAVMTGWAPS